MKDQTTDIIYPLVSICIPTYNGAQFIAEAIESAIDQTYSNLEIVVSDDASNDETLEIIESYKNRTTVPINIYHHKPNGIGANWNNCIKHAKGTYIKFLFQDDVLLPQCVEKMVEVLENDSTIGLVTSKRNFIVEASYLNDETKKWVKKYSDLQSTLDLTLSNGVSIIDKNIFKSEVFFNSPLNKVGEPSVVLFRKEIVKEIGYYRKDLKQVLDYEFYYRLLKKYKIAIINTKLVKFRLHNSQATVVNKGQDSLDYITYDKIIYKHYFWYLNKKMKIYYLKKYNAIAMFFFKIIKKIK